MTNSSENTPFLASNGPRDDSTARNDPGDEIPIKTPPANAHFKRPIKLLTICVSITSVIATILLTAAVITSHFAPRPGLGFGIQSSSFPEIVICVTISSILSTLMIFLQPPITVNLLIDLILTISILISAGNAFRFSIPDQRWCFNPYNNQRFDAQCMKLIQATKILIIIGSGLSFLVGLLYLVLALLRVVGISRTEFWKQNGMFSSDPSKQYTFQITLGFLKKCPEDNDGVSLNSRPEPRSGGVEGQLIDA